MRIHVCVCDLWRYWSLQFAVFRGKGGRGRERGGGVEGVGKGKELGRGKGEMYCTGKRICL